MKKKSQKGFTSVQISIFLSIISIILCIALPIYLKISYEAKYSLCKARMKNVKDALEKFHNKDATLKYPTESEYQNFEKSGFIDKFPTCPVTKTPYKYEPIWDNAHQNIIDFVLYCDSSNAHEFIGKKGYPKCNSKGIIEPDKDKDNSLKNNQMDEEQKENKK